MQVEVVRELAADILLTQQQFLKDWQILSVECPWATSFQGPDFAATWYRCYRSRFRPLFLVSRDNDKQLAGLLPLAISAEGGQVFVAGGVQAEYQTWVCRADLSESFPWQALRTLRREVPNAELTFRYLPPGTPTNWIGAGEAKGLCRLQTLPRPLLRLTDARKTADALSKKANKWQLSRLKKIGPLEFKRITDPDEFRWVLNTIIEYYDFRQAAVHGVTPFRDDELKKGFHLAMSETPGLIHVTVLKAGDLVAAVHLNVVSRKEVHLGIITHNPFLAAHSPGKFHILMLADLLRKEGYETIDMTPGGEFYKDRFADDHDEVQILTVFGSALERARHDLWELTAGAAKKVLGTINVSPTLAKAVVEKLRRVHPARTPATVARQAREWVYRCREMRIYYYDAGRARGIEAPQGVRRDVLGDLLAYEPAEDWQSRRVFLSSALKQIEKGLHFYSYAENGRLVHYGWLAERQDRSFITEVRQEFVFPPNSACLFDYYTFPQARGRGLYSISLRTMLRDAASIPDTARIYIAVLADNWPSRKVIEKVGFIYETSLFEEVRFGSPRRWKTPT